MTACQRPIEATRQSLISTSLALAQEPSLLANRVGGPAEQVSVLDSLVLLLTTVGDMEGYQAAFETMATLTEGTGLAVFEWNFRMVEGRSSLRHGLADGVAQTADTVAELAATAAAEILLSRMRPYSHLIAANTTTLEGAMSRPMARLAALLGKREEAAALFANALETHRRLDAPYWIARTELNRLGARRWTDVAVTDPAALLDEARQLAQHHGYAGLLREAEDLTP